MSVHINGYWVKKSHLLPSIKLARMYAWRHHTIFTVVRNKVAEWEEQGKKSYEWEREEYPEIVRLYQADPHFTEVVAYDWGKRYFIRWVDHMSGISPQDMIDELLLPWKHEWYDGRVMEGTINNDRAWAMADKMDEFTADGTYFYIPIIRKTDPIKAIIWDIWPPAIRELRRVGALLNDGVDSAPIPVFVDYRKC